MLLDTSGLIALLDAREPMHQKARDEYNNASKRLTLGYVLAELVALSNSRGVPSDKVLQFVMALLANPDIETCWPDRPLTSQAIFYSGLGRGRAIRYATQCVLC